MGIRNTVATVLLGYDPQQERAAFRETTERLWTAYLDGPYQTTPDQLAQALQEMDSGLLDDLVQQLYYERIGILGYEQEPDKERERAINEARRLNRYDVVTQWVVRLWTNYGFGENITIQPEDAQGQDVWTEYWDADRNRAMYAPDRLHQLSDELLVDGELFLTHYISTLDGVVTTRRIDPKEIVQIVTVPDDKYTPLFYKRQWAEPGRMELRTLYYPDWLAVITGLLEQLQPDPETGELRTLAEIVLPKDAQRADLQNNLTWVVLQHIAHNRKGDLRGWPLMAAGAPWARAHKQFREDRAAVARSVAMFVNKLKVKGGTRGIDAMRSKIQSSLTSGSGYFDTNPAPAAASTWLENDAADLQRLPLFSGAGDAKTDGEALLLMAGLAGGVFPHWLGAGDAYRLATATAMEAPLLRQFSRYQRFWGGHFRDLVRIVLWAAGQFGGAAVTDFNAKVSTDRLVETDVAALASSMNQVLTSALQPYMDDATVPPKVVRQILARLWLMVLQALGVEDADAIASDETFLVDEAPTPDEYKAQKAAANPFGPEQGQDDTTGPEEADTVLAHGDPLEPVDGVEYTAEDIRTAIRDWDDQHPESLRGLLDAEARDK